MDKKRTKIGFRPKQKNSEMPDFIGAPAEIRTYDLQQNFEICINDQGVSGQRIAGAIVGLSLIASPNCEMNLSRGLRAKRAPPCSGIREAGFK